MWSQIINKNVLGMMSPPLLNDFCKALDYALEGQRTAQSCENESMDSFNMPISKENT